VPKVYVYNLFLEFMRILSPSGFCAMHLLSCNNIREHGRFVPFAQEIGSQLRNEDTHWHHFYAFDELLAVLADGVEAKQIDVVDGEVSIWASFAKTGPAFRRADLPNESHLAIVRERMTAPDGARLPEGTATAPIPGAPLRGLTIGRIVRGGMRRMRAAARGTGRVVFGVSTHGRCRSRAGQGWAARATSDSAMPGAAPGRATGQRLRQVAAVRLLPWARPARLASTPERMRRKLRLAARDQRCFASGARRRAWSFPGSAPELIDAFVGEIDDVGTRIEDSPSPMSISMRATAFMSHIGDLVRSIWRSGGGSRRSPTGVSAKSPVLTAARQIFDHPGIGQIASTIFACGESVQPDVLQGTEQALHQDTCVFHVFPRNFMMGI
jgi:hypothetical protein